MYGKKVKDTEINNRKIEEYVNKYDKVTPLTFFEKFLIIDSKDEVEFLNSKGYYYSIVKYGLKNKKDANSGYIPIYIFCKYEISKDCEGELTVKYFGDELMKAHYEYQDMVRNNSFSD